MLLDERPDRRGALAVVSVDPISLGLLRRPDTYGADVVALTRDKDVVEGSLDFAAWFKGRLYLFGTQESHDTFVANPAAYATPVGIE